MSDLIDRQAAIDAVHRNYDAILDFHSNGKTVASSIEDILSKLPSEQPEQWWIPCSERLPDEKDAGVLKKLGIEKISEDVLATVEVKGERMTVTASTYDGKWDWNMKYAFPDYKIIAWMPLPEPYQGGGENETD